MTPRERSFSAEVLKILYRNEENGYTVCRVSDADGGEYTLLGTLPALEAGERLEARAKLAVHPVHGEQWRVTEYERSLPHSREAILHYLSSRAIRGIGKKRAERIVERFGEDTLSILEHSPEMLSAIPGISPKKAREMGEEFRAQFGLRQVLLFFGGTFGPKTSLAIHRALGAGAVELVRRDPYLLSSRVRGIGFLRADEFARSIGYAADSPGRITAALEYVLEGAWRQEGQVYLPRAELLLRARGLLSLDDGEIGLGLELLLQSGRAVEESGDRVYLRAAHELECEAARRLAELSRIRLLHTVPNAEEVIRRTEESEGIIYSEGQRAAILAAAQNPFTVITGGPGTGKTTLTRALTRLFCDLGMKVCLAAPTGRAAKRMSEKAQIEARTLHRVLEMSYASEESEPRFGKNESEPLSESVFLIDEVSMVDLELLVHFLRAVKPGSRIIFIGDADQLPSVGAGNVLADLISSGAFSVTRLEVIYRQGGESSILRYAHEIRRGEHHRLRENEGDLFYLARESGEATAECVAELLSARLPRAYGEESLENTQVLAPARRGAAGTQNLNRILQARLNPPGPGKREVEAAGVIFREGDRVMQTKNDYDLIGQVTDESGLTTLTQGVFNGDIGKIESIDAAAESLTVRFDRQSVVTYPFSLLEELEHAYAVTVHKSQGSEYETVVLALSGTPPQLRLRSLLYTAVTRAKRRLILVGSQQLSAQMARSPGGSGRCSGLADRIREAL